MRYFIECVKTGSIHHDTKQEFFDFIKALNHDHIILGCTEFPLLIDDKIVHPSSNLHIWDPLTEAITFLQKNLNFKQ